MNDNRDRDSAWAKPRPDGEAFSTPAASTVEAGNAGKPSAAAGSGAERWQIILAWVIFPIPVAFYGLIVALILGVVDFPNPISDPCTTECLQVRAEVAAAFHDPAACDKPGRRVCIVPLGSMALSDLEGLQDYYQNRYGIEVAVLPGLDIPPDYLADYGGQAPANDLVALMQQRYERQDKDPQVTLIGLTTVDMFSPASEAWWGDFAVYFEATKVGVISSARMHPSVFGIKLEDAAGELRLQKQMNVLVGAMHFNLRLTSVPTEAMYNDISSPWDLDAMPADLPIAPASRQNRRN